MWTKSGRKDQLWKQQAFQTLTLKVQKRTDVYHPLIAIGGQMVWRKRYNGKDDLVLWCHLATRACTTSEWWEIKVQEDCFLVAWFMVVVLLFSIRGAGSLVVSTCVLSLRKKFMSSSLVFSFGCSLCNLLIESFQQGNRFCMQCGCPA